MEEKSDTSQRRARRPPRWGAGAHAAEGIHVLKRLVVGRARPSRQARRIALPKRLALPVFASDSLSSVAYATEEALLVLRSPPPRSSPTTC